MGLIQRTRRNHGLEHATISVLTPHLKRRATVVGYSVSAGFLILADVDTPRVTNAVTEALRRMREGEQDLAVSPFCGTNILIAALMATLGVTTALRWDERGFKRLNRGFSNATLAILASRPLGGVVQQHFTTSGDMDGVSIRSVTRYKLGPLILHWVATEFDS